MRGAELFGDLPTDVRVPRKDLETTYRAPLVALREGM
jgi:hypothetical protein